MLVNLPSFGSGHVLYSKLVSEPCKKLWNKILKTVNSTLVLFTYQKYLHKPEVHTSVPQHF